MAEPLTYLTAFLLGFLGSVHCIGMCGGIVGALSMNSPQRIGRPHYNPWMLHLSYHLGRILTYGILGLIAGLAGLWLASSHDTAGLVLRSLSGILLILMALYILGATQSLTWLERTGSGIWKRIQPLSKGLIPVQYPKQGILLGLIWGFLPCGLVYSTLSWALVSASSVKSAALMMAFGLGNLPALLSLSAFTQQLTRFKQHAVVKFLIGFFIFVFGLWTLISPWV